MTDIDYPTYASLGDLTDEDVILSEDFTTLSGRLIRIRGLSRVEVLKLRKVEVDFEATMLSYIMVAPGLNTTSALAWMTKAPAGEIEEVIERGHLLSGLNGDAGKAAYKSLRSESGA
jgi:hypothetical protein